MSQVYNRKKSGGSQAVQWLLIGGPADGRVVRVDKNYPILVASGTAYLGQNYLQDGRLYRLGFVDPKDHFSARIRILILQTGVENFAGHSLPITDHEGRNEK